MTTRLSSLPQTDSLRPWRTFFLALFLYALLSVREMSAWTKPVWVILAFAVIPAVAPLVLGRGGTAGGNIRATLWSVGGAMALYTGFHLIRLHRGIGSTSDAGSAINVFFAGLVVCVVYALIAGLVASLVRLLWARLDVRTGDR